MVLCEPIWLQKATKYIPKSHENKIKGAWIQQKYDGQAIQSVCNDSVKVYANSIAKKSNTFTEYTTKVPHIVNELKCLDFHGILQGEIYSDHLLDDETNFKYTIGVLKDHRSYIRQCSEGLVKYVIYDMPSHPGPYKERYVALWDLFKKHPEFKYVSLAPILDINYNNSWETVFHDMVMQGREGVVLYNQENLYKHSEKTNGRNPGIWKIKASEAKEVCAIEKIEGEPSDKGGKHVGSLGSLICVDGNGKKFKIGSFKLTDEERKDIWDNVEVPFILEMRAASETKDSYRHPVMTRFRPDKDVDSWNSKDE